MSDELDDILDKIKNRWDTDLTESVWDDSWLPPKEEERDNEQPSEWPEATSKRNVPKRANRSRKKNKGNRRRK